jgi:hypothetical protein
MSLLAGVNEASVGEYYFALRNDPSLNNAAWSLYPAVSTVDMSLNAISRCIQLEIDGQFLDATPNDLLLNGVPIATINNLSDIADWSLYASLSGGVDMATYSIRNISGLIFTGGNVLRAAGGKALVNGSDVVRLWSQCNALGNVNMGGHFFGNVGTGLGSIKTGNDDNILVNDIDVVTKWSDFPAQSNVDMGTNGINNAGSIQTTTLVLDNQNITATADDLFINGTPAGRLWSTLPAVSDISMAQHSLQDLSSIDFYYGPGASVVLNASGGFLYANGVQLAEGTSVNEWSRQPAVSDVNMNGNRLDGGVFIGATTPLLNQEAMNIRGNAKFGGNFIQYTNKNQGVTAWSYIGDSISITNAISNYSNASTNVELGRKTSATTYPSTTTVYGGCTIDGGNLRGCTIGCLPANTGINANRLDVLPVGVNMTSATYIALLPLGAGSFTCGGALALAAGSYMTLEHSFGVGSNGIYVQDAARDDAARMVFEFGGSIGNSIDTPARAGRMEFYGTGLFVSNIAANTGRYPRLPYLNIQDVSSLRFYSGPSGGGASLIAGPSGALTISGNVSIPSLTISGFNVTSDLNMNGFNISNVGTLRSTCNIVSNVVATNLSATNLNANFLRTLFIQTLSYGTPIYNFANIICSNDNLGNPVGLFTDQIGSAFTPVVSLSGRLAFAPTVAAGQSTNSTIAAGTTFGVALVLGGKTQINGSLDLTNNVLSNVNAAVINALTINSSINMTDGPIFGCSSIATRTITGVAGSLALNGVDLNFSNQKGTNLADPVADRDVANKQYVDAHNPSVSSTFGVGPVTTALSTIGTIVLPMAEPSAINTTATVVVSNSGPNPQNVSFYIVANFQSNAYITSTVFPNAYLTIPVQYLSAVLPAGNNLVELKGFSDASTGITTRTTNIICTAGFS